MPSTSPSTAATLVLVLALVPAATVGAQNAPAKVVIKPASQADGVISFEAPDEDNDNVGAYTITRRHDDAGDHELHFTRGGETALRVDDDGVWMPADSLRVGDTAVADVIRDLVRRLEALENRTTALEEGGVPEPEPDKYQPPSSGLIGYYDFEGACVAGPIADLSPHDNDLTVNDGGCTTGGYHGLGWRFYGTNSDQLYRATLGGFDGGANPISLVAWWRAETRLSGTIGVFGVGTTATQAHLYLRGWWSDKFSVGADSPTDTWHTATSGPSTQDQRWYHIALTYDGSTTLKLYIDGSLVMTANTNQPLALARSLTLAGDEHNDNMGDVVMDEVYVYNRAISSGEVSAMYTAFPSWAPSATVGSDRTDITEGRIALYRFTDACASSSTPSTVADESGNGNTLTRRDGTCENIAGRSTSTGWKFTGGNGMMGGPQLSGTLSQYAGGSTSGGIMVCAWVNVLSNKCSSCSGMGVFGFGTTATTKHFYLRIQFSDSNDYKVGADNPSDAWHSLGTGANQLNQWKHLCFGYTGRAAYLFVDGDQRVVNLNKNGLSLTNLLTIGSDSHNDNPINAVYADVSVYRRVLTGKEVDFLRNTT